MNCDQRITIRDAAASDRDWIEDFINKRWGSNRVVSAGVMHDVPQLPGFIAWRSGARVGLLTYQTVEKEFEIVTLESVEEKVGIGSAMISKAVDLARKSRCKRVWLITTNDNMPAIAFLSKKRFSPCRHSPKCAGNITPIKTRNSQNRSIWNPPTG